MAVVIGLLTVGASVMAALALDATRQRRETATEALVKWAVTKAIRVESGRCETSIDGVPVTLVAGAQLTASARYVLGTGPDFSLTVTPFLPRASARRRDANLSAAETLVQAVHSTYRRRGLASDAVPRVVKAIEGCVRDPLREPDFSAEDGIVHVVGDFRAIDVLAALAGAIAAYDLKELAPYAKILAAEIEIGDDGLAFFDVARRVPIRFAVRAAESGAGLVTTLSGTVESGAPDLVSTPFEAFGTTRGKLAAPRPDAAEALDWLVEHGARIAVSARRIEVRYASPPASASIGRAIDSLEVLLSPGGESAYR